MSKKNRKFVYDKLVAEGKEDKISKALQTEFGSVKAEPTPKPIAEPKTKVKK